MGLGEAEGGFEAGVGEQAGLEDAGVVAGFEVGGGGGLLLLAVDLEEAGSFEEGGIDGVADGDEQVGGGLAGEEAVALFGEDVLEGAGGLLQAAGADEFVGLGEGLAGSGGVVEVGGVCG